jgi:hypothetical protein
MTTFDKNEWDIKYIPRIGTELNLVKAVAIGAADEWQFLAVKRLLRPKWLLCQPTSS